MTTNIQRISDAEYSEALAAGRTEDIHISVHGLLTAILLAGTSVGGWPIATRCRHQSLAALRYRNPTPRYSC
jgi:hypothetical protein